MDDYKYLREIEKISSTNTFVNYIVDRVSSNDYRGIQCSQHNRLTYNYFSTLVSIIYNIAGDNIFDIHIGDDKGILQPQAHIYYEIVNAIKDKIGKGTINSVKKNTFPDIARMGFLERYNKYGIKITEGTSCASVYSVRLSSLGIKFAQASAFERIKLFTDGIDIITKNTASELVELLYLNDYGIDSIDILEFMYILSDDRDNISANDKLRLLLDYRRLTSYEKEKINDYLKLFCEPKNRKSFNNKTLLRDYNNWKNEAQQIYTLLANSTYFKVDGRKLILNTGNFGLFDEQTKRGEKSKSEYFKNHRVSKNNSFELHHIVPFARAQNKSDTVFIDDFKNLIYLSESKHSEFTITKNKNVVMKYTKNNPNLLFMDFDGAFILVDSGKDALISVDLLPQIKAYNDLLLKKFYYI